ncbi:hypothetical protein GTA08_BOTSDO03268 [Neofusicoccum parvum]|uniref:Uncharacterized protein n=1 Tax=Neofusicoccum parvum TaxID=310453 RepID=A0ACB5SBN6_9PEZI|nr:hypothetical protein GTA08_BOTSDO03268 [Neofusicoccum parvum]
MSHPVLLILGAGPNIGQSTADAFAAKGYKVALVARGKEDGWGPNGELEIRGDLSDPETIPRVFSKVKSEFGHPSVVIYNGAARTVLSGDDPLQDFSLENFNNDMNVNVTSGALAAHHAVLGFKELPAKTPKVFFFTGNKLPVLSLPQVFWFGMGKSAAAKMIWDLSTVYRDKGFRFYFTDERTGDGKPAMMARSGPAHGEVYVRLTETQEQGPWYYTFVKDQGYVDFSEDDKQV